MFWVMRGLIKSIFILMAITAIGVGVSILITNDLNSKVAGARQSGVEEGRTEGHQAGFQRGSAAGYQEGSKLSYARSQRVSTTSGSETGFYFSYNPTYDEVLELFAETGKSSAWEIHDYAEAHGMRTAYVRVQIARPATVGKVWVYRLVAFDTIDQGLLIFEPWSHDAIQLEIGEPFREINGFQPAPYDDEITKVTVIW